MKKLIFTLTIMLITASFAVAQTTITITGAVTNSATNAAVPNHQVNILIIDSMSAFYFTQSVNTNVNGAYTVTVQNYPTSAIIYVTTVDCNNQTQSQFLTSSPYIANFSICVGTPPNCQANFVAIPDSSNPMTIHFIDQTIGNPTSWSWNFGDNGTSTLQNPTHTYAQNGTYTVVLTVYCSNIASSYSSTVVISGGTTSCQAIFTSNPDSSNQYLIHFHDQSTGNPTSFSWNFGDNSSSSLQNPSHTYAQAGTYTVTLIISGTGCQSTTSNIITVGGSTGCQAIFTFNPDVANPAMINFFDQSTGNPTTFSWSFGDNSSSSLQNPSHIYAQSGTYTVTLSISGPGCQSTTSNTVIIGGGPTTGNIYGQIFAGNMVADNGLVYLIDFDSITNILSAVDTTSIDSMGFYGFTNVSFGSYYVKAALSPMSSNFNSYFPTYYGHQMFWSNATTINLNSASAIGNISLIAGNNPGGPGFIGGNVLQGANKGPGDPIENVIVMLLDLSDNPIAIDLTDVNGEFGFSNIAYGTYKVWIDVPGKTTTPALVTISATTPGVSNVNIIINSTTIVVGIENSPSIFNSNVGKVYPNPSFDNSKLEINLTEATQLKISIYNTVGQLVKNNTLELSSGRNVIDIKGSVLDNGIYTLRLEANIGHVYRKFVKVSK